MADVPETVTEQEAETALTAARNIMDRVFPLRADMTMNDQTVMRRIALYLLYSTLVNPGCRGDAPAPGKTGGQPA